jgi:hypothetical protein
MAMAFEAFDMVWVRNPAFTVHFASGTAIFSSMIAKKSV